MEVDDDCHAAPNLRLYMAVAAVHLQCRYSSNMKVAKMQNFDMITALALYQLTLRGLLAALQYTNFQLPTSQENSQCGSP